jgi:hypothetical protein
MIRIYFLIGLSLTLIISPSFAASPLKSMEAIRTAYKEAITKSSKASKFHKKMSKLSSPEPLKLGYKGAAKTLKAKHSWSPFAKMRYLKSGMAILSKAIKQKPSDIELRFLRLSVAYFIPDFLGYREYVKEDKAQIIESLLSKPESRKPEKVVTVILDFLCEEELCTQEQENRLRQMYS